MLNKEDFLLIKKFLNEYQNILLFRMCEIVNMEQNDSDVIQEILNEKWLKLEKEFSQVKDLLKKLY